MSLSDAMKKLKYDSRLADYMIKNGEITQADIDAHLSKLEDVAHNSEKLKIFEGEESEQNTTLN